MVSEKVFMKGKAVSAEQWLLQASQLLCTEAAAGQSLLRLDDLGVWLGNVWHTSPFPQAGGRTQSLSLPSALKSPLTCMEYCCVPREEAIGLLEVHASQSEEKKRSLE